MKEPAIRVLALAAACLTVAAAASPRNLADLKILYVGNERSEAFVTFLKPHVAAVSAQSKSEFSPVDAAAFDVVLLDWPQTGRPGDFPPKTSPLGKREEWGKPTVLLGSAGLNLAVVWKLKGGSGCTCMDPLAYDLRQHEVFDQPFHIDRTTAIQIPTPPDFKAEIKEPKIEVLPLVADHQRTWNPGWCSYAYDFARNPDTEFFCGGVNHKTPTAAGLWRQGNLLHFGFEQSPAEMNEQGRHLLLNSITYIARFTEDRPIATTPSVFAGHVARSRSSLARALRNPEYQLDWIKEDVSPALWSKLVPLGRDKMAAWVDQEGRFLHPNQDLRLEIDEDLAALGVCFDQPEFFDRTLRDLGLGGGAGQRARRLLARYVPGGPAGADATQWAAWWGANKPYAFASDSSDYRWYVDPLAKKRGIPSNQLRGPLRADPGGPVR